MLKIAIVSCYFGKLTDDFRLWINGCKYNNDIDFYFVTDQNINFNLPKNVKVFMISFRDLKEKIDKVFNFKTSLYDPYKLCDFKVAYGLIFNEFLKNYDYWGYCDSDMVLGRIRYFLPDEVLVKYDKILPLGHLSLYKNTVENNTRFMRHPEIMDYHEVFTSTSIFQFDETPGIYKIFKEMNYPFLEYVPFLDIVSSYNKRLIKYCYAKELYNVTVCNYKYEAYYFDKGRIIEQIIDKKEEYNEYIYIHYSKRHFIIPENVSYDFFLFLPDCIKSVNNYLFKEELFEHRLARNIFAENVDVLFIKLLKKLKKKIEEKR